MALWQKIEYEQASPAVRAVFDDIRATRGSDYINDVWKVLANDPGLLERSWRVSRP
jgi:alkylhydroperoxidase family enzyme